MDGQQQEEKSLGLLTTPLSARGWPTWITYAMAIIGVIYILNPTLGVIEFLPDNLPIIGNLDEGVAFMLLWAGLVEFFEGKKYKGTTESKSDAPDPDDDQVIDGQVIEVQPEEE
jgi:hypothetical protein